MTGSFLVNIGLVVGVWHVYIICSFWIHAGIDACAKSFVHCKTPSGLFFFSCILVDWGEVWCVWWCAVGLNELLTVQ